MKKQIADMDKEVQRELLNPSNDMDEHKKSYGSETKNVNYWKPPINQSYETLVLANTEMNKKVRQLVLDQMGGTDRSKTLV